MCPWILVAGRNRAAIAPAALHHLPGFEHAPKRGKPAVVGTGRASQQQVARSVRSMLSGGQTLRLDESDAARVAIGHSFTWQP